MNDAIDPHKLALFAELMANVKGTSATPQRQRVREVLARGYPLNTFEASRHLDVYHCPARVRELRREGLDIVTHWVTVITESGDKHQVGNYLLRQEVPGAV